jgi:hypothetical protein
LYISVFEQATHFRNRVVVAKDQVVAAALDPVDAKIAPVHKYCHLKNITQFKLFTREHPAQVFSMTNDLRVEFSH